MAVRKLGASRAAAEPKPRTFPRGTTGPSRTVRSQRARGALTPGTDLELYVMIPSLSSLAATVLYIYYGNAGAAEANDADARNVHYGGRLH